MSLVFLDIHANARTRSCVRIYVQKHIEAHLHPHTHTSMHPHTSRHFILCTRAHLSLAVSVYLVYVHASLVRSASPFTTHREHTGQPLRLGPEDWNLGKRRARPRRRLHSCIFSSGAANYCFCMTLNNSTQLSLPCHAYASTRSSRDTTVMLRSTLAVSPLFIPPRPSQSDRGAG